MLAGNRLLGESVRALVRGRSQERSVRLVTDVIEPAVQALSEAVDDFVYMTLKAYEAGANIVKRSKTSYQAIYYLTFNQEVVGSSLHRAHQENQYFRQTSLAARNLADPLRTRQARFRQMNLPDEVTARAWPWRKFVADGE